MTNDELIAALKASEARGKELEEAMRAARIQCETEIAQAAQIRKRATSPKRQQYGRGLAEAAKNIRAALKGGTQ